jgi:quercetin dioxygenase-like cupin family protein
MKRAFFLSTLLPVAVFVGAAFSAEPAEAPHHLVVAHDKLAWGPMPPQFPAGAQLAVVQGNPGGDGFYVVRARFPAGYRIMPHWHPGAENVTVISGKMHIAAGDAFDDKAGDVLEAGGYVSLPALMHHYAWAESASEIQIHGVGPLAIFYVDPKDDPTGVQK